MGFLRVLSEKLAEIIQIVEWNFQLNVGMLGGFIFFTSVDANQE